jgi:hypothetical protein
MKKIDFFCICKVTEDFGMDPHPLGRGTEPRIQISSGSIQKCHRSGTLQIKITISIIQIQTLFILTVKWENFCFKIAKLGLINNQYNQVNNKIE